MNLMDHHGLLYSFILFLYTLQTCALKEAVSSEQWVIKCDQSFSSIRHATRLAGFHKISKIQWGQRQRPLVRVKRNVPHSTYWNDPYYEKMWHVNRASRGDGYDMNVEEAWNLGYSGKGIVVSIMDDGVDYTHPDLLKNYDPEASIDLNGDDLDPMPDDSEKKNRHGTRCAGQIAAEANNSICVPGIAYNAKIGGIRMLDGTVDDHLEFQTISFKRNHIDIYSGSWGPEDSGRMYEGPGPLTMAAFKKGVLTGRHGLGSIYIWASGNGGVHFDSCNSDGYVSSPYTIAVGSVSERNVKPWYLEACSSTLTSTYSSGGHFEKTIPTIDMDHGCIDNHTGTSASAPIATAIVALLLEANPRLTWRDVQHIIVLTANSEPVKDTGNFTANGVGKLYSPWFGYGLMDAGKIVRLGELWRGVPPYHTCQSVPILIDRPLSSTFNITIPFDFNGCSKDDDQAHRFLRSSSSSEQGEPIRYLEQVQVFTDIKYSRRGLLQLSIISPSGTVSVLQQPRKFDTHEGETGMIKWPLNTVQLWGEEAKGRWRIRLDNLEGLRTIKASADHVGKWGSVWMVVHGSEHQPIRLKPPNPNRMPSEEWFSPLRKYIVQDPEWQKVYTCHSECEKGGCWGPAADQCLGGCKHFTTISGLCVAVCPPGTTVYDSSNLSLTLLMSKVGSSREPPPTISSSSSAPYASRVKPVPQQQRARSTSVEQQRQSSSLQATTCHPCAANCASCLRPRFGHDCTSCSIGYFLLPLPESTTRASTNERRSTSSSTRRHRGDWDRLLTKLIAASSPKTRRSDWLVGSCRAECPLGFHRDLQRQICIECPENCEQCVGDRGVGAGCLRCRRGFRLVNGKCKDGASVDGRCPKGQYLFRSECVHCSPLCANDGCLPSGHCVRCRHESAVLYNYTCTSQCPSGWWYANAAIKPPLCQPCPPGCVDCRSQAKSSDQSIEEVVECLSCLPNLVLRDGLCERDASKRQPPGLLHTTNSINNCIDELSCSKCDSDSSSCLECGSSSLLTASYYLPTNNDWLTRLALTEHQGCGGGSSSCTANPDDLVYRCSSKCPMGTFAGLLQGRAVCLPCQPGCLTCKSLRDCSVCQANFYYDSSTKSCLAGPLCRQSHYFDQSSRTCERCHPTCRTCSGPHENECTDCSRHGEARCLLVEGVETITTRSSRCAICCSYAQLLMMNEDTTLSSSSSTTTTNDCMFCTAESAFCQPVYSKRPVTVADDNASNSSSLIGSPPLSVKPQVGGQFDNNNSSSLVWLPSQHPLRFLLLAALIIMAVLTGICFVILLLAYRRRNNNRIGLRSLVRRRRWKQQDALESRSTTANGAAINLLATNAPSQGCHLQVPSDDDVPVMGNGDTTGSTTSLRRHDRSSDRAVYRQLPT